MRCSKSVLLTLVAILATSGSSSTKSEEATSGEMTTVMDTDAPMVTEEYNVPDDEMVIFDIAPIPTTVFSSTEPSPTTHEMTTTAPVTTTAVFETTTTKRATTTHPSSTTTSTTTTTTTTPPPPTTTSTTTTPPPPTTMSTTTTPPTSTTTSATTTTTTTPSPSLKTAASTTREESYGSPCATESDCPKNKNFQCIKKSCQCEPSQIFDLRQQRCIIPLGKECHSDPSCPEFAECFLDRCVCKTGYSMHTLTKCKADDPERKTVLWPRQPKQDNSDKSSCTPSSCDASKGLKCQVGGACTCKDSKEIFIEEFGRCLNTTMQKTLKDALRLVASPNLNLNSLVKLLEKFEETDQATGASTNYNGPVHQLISLLNDKKEKESRPSESQLTPFSSKSYGDEYAAAQEPVPESALPSSSGGGSGGGGNHDFDSISPVAQAPEESIEPLTFSRESGEAIKKPEIREPQPQRTYLPLDNYQPQSQEPAIVQRQAPYGYHPHHHDHGHGYHPGDGYHPYGVVPESTNLFGRGQGQSQGGPGQFFRQGINEGLGQGAIGGGINGYLGRPAYRANLANKFIHGLGHELGYGLADPFVNSIGAAIGNRFRHRGQGQNGGGGAGGGNGGGGGGGGNFGPAPGYYGGAQGQPQGFGGPGGGHGPGPGYGGPGGQGGGFGGPGGHDHHHHHGGGGFGGPGGGYGQGQYGHGPGGGYGGGPGGGYGQGNYGRGPGGIYGGGPGGGQGGGGFGGPGGGHNHGPGGGFGGGPGGGQGGGGQGGGGFGGQGGFAPRPISHHHHGLGSLGGPGGAGGHGQQDLGGLGAGSIGGAGPHHRHRPLLIELAKFAVKSFKLLDRVLPLASAINDALRNRGSGGGGGGGGGGHVGAHSENREIRYGEENPEDLIKEGGILSGFAKFIGKLLRLRTRLEQSDDGRLRNILL